ncbi:unnamed protein product [Mytilus coruscus]|uniref:Uncharacterized protein n=1 Tax=Mytilus coruscus TaxID=42192 RepID=A0A6J7ZX30_MYTCO|nr:unnamed protein product [Mytilus coruscus]
MLFNIAQLVTLKKAILYVLNSFAAQFTVRRKIQVVDIEVADYPCDLEIGLLTSVIEILENILKQSFMHSTTKDDKIKCISLQTEKDSGVTSGVDISKDENELTKDTVVFGGVKPRVWFSDKTESFAEKVTLPLKIETRQNVNGSNRVHHQQLRSTNHYGNSDPTEINFHADQYSIEKIEMSVKLMEEMIKELHSELAIMKIISVEDEIMHL